MAVVAPEAKTEEGSGREFDEEAVDAAVTARRRVICNQTVDAVRTLFADLGEEGTTRGMVDERAAALKNAMLAIVSDAVDEANAASDPQTRSEFRKCARVAMATTHALNLVADRIFVEPAKASIPSVASHVSNLTRALVAALLILTPPAVRSSFAASARPLLTSRALLGRSGGKDEDDEDASSLPEYEGHELQTSTPRSRPDETGSATFDAPNVSAIHPVPPSPGVPPATFEHLKRRCVMLEHELDQTRTRERAMAVKLLAHERMLASFSSSSPTSPTSPVVMATPPRSHLYQHPPPSSPALQRMAAQQSDLDASIDLLTHEIDVVDLKLAFVRTSPPTRLQ